MMVPLIPPVLTMIKDKTLNFFPTQTPHTGRVWVFRNSYYDKEVCTLDQLVSRIFLANLARNMYPMTRQAFLPLDPCHNKFPLGVVLGKTVIATKDVPIVDYTKVTPIKSLVTETVIDLKDFDPVESDFLEYDPVSTCTVALDNLLLDEGMSLDDKLAQLIEWMNETKGPFSVVSVTGLMKKRKKEPIVASLLNELGVKDKDRRDEILIDPIDIVIDKKNEFGEMFDGISTPQVVTKEKKKI